MLSMEKYAFLIRRQTGYSLSDSESEIPPEIKQDLQLIDQVSSDLKMKLYVVGGFPRDIVAGFPIDEDTDLDVTEELGNGFDLSFFVAAKYGLAEPVVYDSSGTAMIIMPSGREIEFHNSYHNIAHIIDQLYVMGAEPTPINKDIYSRDFTINTLLLDIATGEILDITGNGISDIENRILRTPLSPQKTLSINPKIILRGIRFKVQFGLTEDPEYSKAIEDFVPELIQFLKNNPQSQMVSRTVKKTFSIDPDKAFYEFDKYGLIPFLPKFPEIQNIIKKNYLGTTITSPAGFSIAKSRDQVIIAQTTMIKHLMEERDKHKEYIKRKKRERSEKRKRKFDILDRAQSGYYDNQGDPEFEVKKNKDYKSMGEPGREFIPKKRR